MKVRALLELFIAHMEENKDVVDGDIQIEFGCTVMEFSAAIMAVKKDITPAKIRLVLINEMDENRKVSNEFSREVNAELSEATTKILREMKLDPIWYFK